jgi:hypothetical protein
MQRRSEWREFSMMLHQVQQAIEPPLDLATLCQRWPNVAASLAERPRKRVLQLTRPLFWNAVGE